MASGFSGTDANGSIYVEFNVLTNSLIQLSKKGWYKILEPDVKVSQKYLLGKKVALTPNKGN